MTICHGTRPRRAGADVPIYVPFQLGVMVTLAVHGCQSARTAGTRRH